MRHALYFNINIVAAENGCRILENVIARHWRWLMAFTTLVMIDVAFQMRVHLGADSLAILSPKTDGYVRICSRVERSFDVNHRQRLAITFSRIRSPFYAAKISKENLARLLYQLNHCLNDGYGRILRDLRQASSTCFWKSRAIRTSCAGVSLMNFQ